MSEIDPWRRKELELEMKRHDVTVPHLAEKMGLSPTQVYRIRQTGEPAKRFEEAESLVGIAYNEIARGKKVVEVRIQPNGDESEILGYWSHVDGELKASPWHWTQRKQSKGEPFKPDDR